MNSPMPVLLAAAALAGPVASAPAAAAPIDWAKARPVSIVMADGKYHPDVVTLRRGQPVRLTVHNDTGKTHDLTAPELFRTATLPPADRRMLYGYRIKLRGGDSQTIRFVPRAPGTFKFHSSSFGDDVLGMTGRFFVR